MLLLLTLCPSKYVLGGDDMKKLTDEQLEELAREKQREYHREWQRKNRDKVREYQKRYWIKKALEDLKGEAEQME